jgi:hypothetical protein
MKTKPHKPGLETGLQAWIAGDLDTLQTLLAPNVTLRGPEPGPFDCTGRDQVLLLLHDRKTTGHQPKTGRIEQVDDHTFVVTTNLSGDAGATRLTVAAGQVVQMQQRRSRRSGRHRSRPSGRYPSVAKDSRRMPALATARLASHGDRTLLHVATDWPGHYPNVAAIINTLRPRPVPIPTHPASVATPRHR